MIGNVIVGQSGGPTSVINSSLVGVYKTARDRGAKKVYGMLHGIQGFLDEQYVDLSTQIHSDMDIELLKRTPSAFLGSCRYKLPTVEESPETYAQIFEMFESLNNDEINAIIISSSVKNLLDTELNDINVKIKSIYNFKISIEKNDIVKVVNVTNTPFNVYIAGGDGYGSIDYTFNTDVNMVATINPTTRKILLTSIPRDYYVNLVGQGPNAYDKLTHAGYYGIEESVKTVENLLDTDINYYVKINFSTIEGIVDAIGGVDVYSEYEFTASDGTYSYVKGYQHLDGKKALRFARERKSFATGDVQRVKNQQKVVEAMINKITSSTALISSYDRILDSVSDNLDTNMPSKDISRLVKMQLNDMRGWTIESQNAVGTGQMGPTYTFPTLNLYTMLPDKDSVNSLKLKINEYLGK